MGRIEAVCACGQKGVAKNPLESALFIAGHGVESDAHAGPWHRQVSMLALEDMQGAGSGPASGIGFGMFAENLVLSGVDLRSAGLGSRLKLGSDVELVITQIGKVCHEHCSIFEAAGDCIMPRLGLFARVEKGGSVAPGDCAAWLDVVPAGFFQVVVITVSDRCSRAEAVDTAGPAVAALLSSAIRAHIYRLRVIPDDSSVITETLRHYSDGHSIDMIVLAGGTGFGARDVTPEAVSSVIDRPTPGLDEAMRGASLLRTPRAMLSRSVSGIRGRTLIISLPGSERGAVENMGVLIPALEHGLEKLRGAGGDCGRG